MSAPHLATKVAIICSKTIMSIHPIPVLHLKKTSTFRFLKISGDFRISTCFGNNPLLSSPRVHNSWVATPLYEDQVMTVTPGRSRISGGVSWKYLASSWWREPCYLDAWLAGGWPTPLKKIRVRQLGWWHSQLNGKMKNVPNHQPDEQSLLFKLVAGDCRGAFQWDLDLRFELAQNRNWRKLK